MKLSHKINFIYRIILNNKLKGLYEYEVLLKNIGISKTTMEQLRILYKKRWNLSPHNHAIHGPEASLGILWVNLVYNILKEKSDVG